ncbi:MAG: SpoVR family protein [Planctomyces sp.]|nr:SpoVR family protein [Planctomyces sp.]MBA4119333.1 SpoVR family protein [Isosphaera sp.]
MPGAPKTDLTPELLDHMHAIRARAMEYGLDFFEVVFEVLPFDTMNQIAAYQGFPVRYPHWRWGMEYEKLSKRDAYGMGRIYEMVINNDPVYAYLQESNSVTDQKLVMAHVFGHADFFKHNLWFGKTNRRMLDEMANHATRVRRHVDRHGHEAVERFIDACLSIESLIDTHGQFIPRAGDWADTPAPEQERNPARAFVPEKLPAKDYMDAFINPPAELDRQRRAYMEARAASRGRVPTRPTRDVLGFLIHEAPLDEWQQDILSIVRDEALYFVPQAMTKIMNEGWASYWHSKLMTRHFVHSSEIVQYADQHSGVVHMPPGGFNPYKIGIELWRDIERRWDTGRHGPAWEALDAIGAREAHDDRSMAGREKIFQVRRIYNDVTFIEEFLTEEFCERHRLFATRKDPHTGAAKVASRDFPRVKQTLLHHLTNRGEPFIAVADGNYRNRGELYLAHQWTGLEVDAARAAQVLISLRLIWGRPVHLHMRIRDDHWLLSCDEPAQGPEHIKRQKISDETPRPAHAVA